MFGVVLALELSIVAFAASQCTNRLTEDKGMTDDYRRVIVDYHNELRNFVAKGEEPGQPRAKNMREMTWDNDLEATAQSWADTCQFQHDPKLQTTLKGTGQNIFMKYSSERDHVTKLDFKSYIFPWYDEVRKFGYNKTFDLRTGHYSQLIWGATNKVGCGYALTKDKEYYYVYFVCNYSPGGNVFGQIPYKEGNIDCEGNEMFRSYYYSDLCDINKERLLACYNPNYSTEHYNTKTTFNNSI